MKLLILDLDETLIHASEETLGRKADFITECYYVYKRPYVLDLIKFRGENFQVGIWTTAVKDFARTVVENIFSSDYPLKFLWSCDRCTRMYDSELMQPYYIKNLAKLKRKGYRLEEIIMVDDTPQKLEKNYGNLVRVIEWRGDVEDNELLLLTKYLSDLKNVDNIRKIEKRSWRSRYKHK